MADDPKPASEDLCLSCGLCCDGSLFWAVSVKKGEKVPVPLGPDGRLRQPCSRLGVEGCSIYPDRPSSCRTFDCHVLKAVQAGDRDMDWALGRVAAMRQTLAALGAALPGRERSLFRRAALFLEENQDKMKDYLFQARHAAALERIAEYERMLRTFRDFE